MRIERGDAVCRALRRIALVVAAVGLPWAYLLHLNGGIALDLGAVHLSSRNPLRVLVGIAVLAVAALLADVRAGWPQRWADDYAWLSAAMSGLVPAFVTAPRLAGLLAIATVAVGVLRGAHVIGGADSYGYVSQAHLWAQGALTVPQPLLDDLPAGVPQEVLAPLGYRLGPDRLALVPIYSPGLPLVMSAVERVGGREAVYLVVPVMAAVVVWLAYLVGRRLLGPHSEAGGLLAAVLVATSPAFVLQLVSPPMSDIVATAWWTGALCAVWSPGARSALLAGTLAALGILTRPNLVLLVLVPGGVLVYDCWWRRVSRMPWLHVLSFAIPVALACVMVGWLNWHWYGSPVASGYGAVDELFDLSYFVPNLTTYTRSLLESQGPLSALALIGGVVLWIRTDASSPRAVLIAHLVFAAAVYGCYAFYFPYEAWWYLRFLFPAFPVFFALVSAGVFALADRLPVGVRVPVVVAVLAAMMFHVVSFGRAKDTFDADGERRYEIAGDYIAQRLPARAAFFAMLHSGSVRYYADRLTVRHDLMPVEHFDAMVTHLEARGYVPYLLLDDAEVSVFQRRFSSHPIAGRLSAPDVNLPQVRVYALSSDASAR